MSWQACAWAQKVGPAFDLEPMTRYVLLTLANYADQEGNNIFPSIATLELNTGLSRNTVRSHIRKLVAAGLMVDVGKVAVGRPGNHATNAYRLRMDVDAPADPVDNPGEEVESRGSTADPLPNQGVKRRRLGGQMTASRGSTADPNTLKNLKEPRAGTRGAGRADCRGCGQSHPAVNLEDGQCPDCLASRPPAPPLDPAQGVAYLRQLRAQGMP